MNDQTIPADKVRELAIKYSGDVPTDPHFLLGEIKADLRALLPSQQPTTGLLGRWAKHPEHGDVVCVAERPASGLVKIAFQDNCVLMSVKYATVALSSLTFPEQAAKPEDVPAGEAWLVDVETPFLSLQSVVAIKGLNKMWLTLEGATEVTWCSNGIITLISPLTPERPVFDLQAKYDELNAKYREAQARIKTLEQPSPVWRIEHDWRNLKAGEYAIDKEGYDGIIRRKSDDGSYWLTDESWVFFPEYAPFIVFPSVDAATPEAIEEAKQARDKERGK